MASVTRMVLKHEQLDSGVTFEQAMEAHRLSNEESLAVPTIAHRMNINYEVMCKLLYGKIWPAARDRWSGVPL